MGKTHPIDGVREQMEGSTKVLVLDSGPRNLLNRDGHPPAAHPAG